jgi:acyl-coenzyme A thioesterase PaaI-like protein
MGGQSEPFWDAVAGRAPKPPAARTLGWEFLAADLEARIISVAFTAPDSFADVRGEVLGGFLAAMLYDTLGPALIAVLPPGRFPRTENLRVDFVRPARLGRLAGEGRVVSLVGDRAELAGASGQVVATATGTARVEAGGPSTE